MPQGYDRRGNKQIEVEEPEVRKDKAGNAGGIGLAIKQMRDKKKARKSGSQNSPEKAAAKGKER